MITGIGFAGRMGSGKDTTADALLEHPDFKTHKRAYRRTSFASMLKKVAMAVCNLSYDDVYTQEGKRKYIPEYGKTVREILQGFGEGLRQHVHKDIWVMNLEHVIKQSIEKGEFFIVTDVRYENEARMIQKYGGVIIRIDRKSVEPTDKSHDHASEKPLSDDVCDYIIKNREHCLKLLKKTIWTYYEFIKRL